MATSAQTCESYCLFDTAIGRCAVAWSERGLTRVQLPEAEPAIAEQRMRRLTGSGAAAEPPPAVARTIEDLQDYLNGRRVEFAAVAVDWRDMADLPRRICEAARGVRWGETVSYGELAGRVGPPASARNVGQAMAHNPLPVVVPCHRVLAKGHRLGGFSAPGGVFTKDRLLTLEAGRRGLAEPPLPGLLS